MWVVVMADSPLLNKSLDFAYDYAALIALGEEIKRMLIASLNTAKGNG
jgi:hypothetical protein